MKTLLAFATEGEKKIKRKSKLKKRIKSKRKRKSRNSSVRYSTAPSFS
jgi:hypothetical protein